MHTYETERILSYRHTIEKLLVRSEHCKKSLNFYRHWRRVRRIGISGISDVV